MVWEGSHRGAAQSASRLRACLSPAAGLACLRAARGAGCIRAPWAEVSVCPPHSRAALQPPAQHQKEGPTGTSQPHTEPDSTGVNRDSQGRRRMPTGWKGSTACVEARPQPRKMRDWMRPPRLIGDEPSPEVAAICDPLRGAAKGMPRQWGEVEATSGPPDRQWWHGDRERRACVDPASPPEHKLVHGVPSQPQNVKRKKSD